MSSEKSQRRPFDLTDVFVVSAVAALAVRYFVNPARPAPPRDAAADHDSHSVAHPEDAAERTARSREPGRGRGARYPWQIPFDGWKDILWRTYAQVNDDRLLLVAAGVVFYAVLAIFPAISAFVSIYGLFTDSATVTQHPFPVVAGGPGGGLRSDRGAGPPRRRQQQYRPRRHVPGQPGLRSVECQCRHEGAHRCAERRL